MEQEANQDPRWNPRSTADTMSMAPRIERARLERLVIEAAKARREAEKRFDKDRAPRVAQGLLAAEIAEDAAVDALIEFEGKR